MLLATLSEDPGRFGENSIYVHMEGGWPSCKVKSQFAAVGRPAGLGARTRALSQVSRVFLSHSLSELAHLLLLQEVGPSQCMMLEYLGCIVVARAPMATVMTRLEEACRACMVAPDERP